MVAVTYGKFHMFPLYHAPARTLPLRSSSRATQSPLYWFVPGLDCDIPLAITSAPHKDFPDLYEKMSGKGECAGEAHRHQAAASSAASRAYRLLVVLRLH